MLPISALPGTAASAAIKSAPDSAKAFSLRRLADLARELLSNAGGLRALLDAGGPGASQRYRQLLQTRHRLKQLLGAELKLADAAIRTDSSGAKYSIAIVITAASRSWAAKSDREVAAVQSILAGADPTRTTVHQNSLQLAIRWNNWATKNFASDLAIPKFTNGSNSTQLMSELETAMLTTVKVLKGQSESATEFLNWYGEAVRSGATQIDIARALRDPGKGEVVTLDNAQQIIDRSVNRLTNQAKSLCSQLGGTLAAFTSAIRTVKGAEDKAEARNRLMAILSLAASLGTSVGSTASCIATFLQVRIRTAAAAVGKTSYENLRTTLPATSPQLAKAKNDYERASALAEVGKGQLGAWSIATPGAWLNMGTNGQRLDALQTSSIDEINVVTADIGNRVNEMRRAAGVLGLPRSLVVQEWGAWGRVGQAMFDAMSQLQAIAHNDGHGLGKLVTTVKILGKAYSRGEANLHYRKAFESYLLGDRMRSAVAEGKLYYYSGHADKDKTGGFFDGDDSRENLRIRIFEMPFGAMKSFPTLRGRRPEEVTHA